MSRAHMMGQKGDGTAVPFRLADVFKVVSDSSINGAGGTAVWTPATGKRIRLMGVIANGATAGNVKFYDATVVGTPIVPIGFAANASTVVDLGPHGIPLSAGGVLLAVGPAGLSSILAYGVEETP